MADLGVTPAGSGCSAEPEPVPVSAVPVSIPNAFAAVDEWCKSRADRISKSAEQHLTSGRSLNAPNYRTMLGEHRAYMAMRSYIHWCRQQDTPDRNAKR